MTSEKKGEEGDVEDNGDAVYVPLRDEEQEEDDLSSPPKRKNRIKGLYFILFFFAFLTYSILNKKVAIAASNYTYALTELSPLTGLVIYGTISLTSRNPGRDRDVPKWKAAFVGILFSLYNMIYNLGNRGSSVPGGIVLLIAKLIVPFSAAFSYLPPLRKRLNFRQALGLAILLAGAAITLIPKYSNASNDSDGGEEAMRILFLIAAQPVLAVAMLFVEYQVSAEHPGLDLVWFWAWLCVFESIAGIPLALPNAAIVGIDIDDVPANLWHGLKCVFAGVNSQNGDKCSGIPVVYVLQIAAGCAFNMSMAAAVRSGGATLMWFVRATTLPFGAFLFAWPLIMGHDAESISLYDGVGVVLVTTALFVYSGTRGSTTALREDLPSDPKAPRSEEGSMPH